MVVESYKELSPSEFFYRNRELAGFTNPSRSLYTAVRELFENAMDACELHGIPPDILIILREIQKISNEVSIYRLYIRDNGSGIPEEHILGALGKMLYSSKYILRQSRGTFGLGGTMALLYGQITTNQPIKVVSATLRSRKVHQYTFSIDIRNNRADVKDFKRFRNKERWHGTIIDFMLEGNYSRVRTKIVEYLKYTATIAPYAEITFIDPEGRFFYFKRTTTKLPKPPKETKPHPHGIDIEILKKMLYESDEDMTLLEFLTNKFHRVGNRIAKKFLAYARIPGEMTIKELLRTSDRKLIERLYRALQNYDGFLAPSANILSPIGKEAFKEGIIKEFEPKYVDVVVRPSSSYKGHPFIVEAAVAYGGKIPGGPGEIVLFRYANKIPLLYDEGSDVSKKILSNLSWSSYRRPMDGPTAFFIHICSTKVPFKSVGKEFIADIPEVEKEIELAVRELLRGLTRYTRQVQKKKEAVKRLGIYQKYLPQIARFSAELAGRKPPDVTKLISRVEEKYKVKKEIKV
jgi:DNA topoisomerase-6 subunit B